MKALLLFIGTVLRSRNIQRRKLGAIPAISKLIQYWWTWTPSLPDSSSEALATLNRAGELAERQQRSAASVLSRMGPSGRVRVRGGQRA